MAGNSVTKMLAVMLIMITLFATATVAAPVPDERSAETAFDASITPGGEMNVEPSNDVVFSARNRAPEIFEHMHSLPAYDHEGVTTLKHIKESLASATYHIYSAALNDPRYFVRADCNIAISSMSNTVDELICDPCTIYKLESDIAHLFDILRNVRIGVANDHDHDYDHDHGHLPRLIYKTLPLHFGEAFASSDEEAAMELSAQVHIQALIWSINAAQKQLLECQGLNVKQIPQKLNGLVEQAPGSRDEAV